MRDNLRWILLMISLIVISTMFEQHYADASDYLDGPRGGCNSSIDKTIYNAGDTITITVSCSSSDLPIIVRIANEVTNLPPQEDDVVFTETKDLINNTARFSYVLPVSLEKYQYVVYVGALETHYHFFFTKPNANQITISDLYLKNSKITQNGTLDFEAKVTDGIGNPIPHIMVIGTLPYQVNNVTEHLTTAQITSFSPDTDYSSTGIVRGSLEIGNIPAATYNLIISAEGDIGVGMNEITIPTQKTISFEVSDKNETVDFMEYGYALLVILVVTVAVYFLLRTKFRHV